MSIAYYTAGLLVQLESEKWTYLRQMVGNQRLKLTNILQKVKNISHLTSLLSEQKHFSTYSVKEREREILATKNEDKRIYCPSLCTHSTFHNTLDFLFSFSALLRVKMLCVHGKTKSLLTNRWSQRRFPLSALVRRDIPCSGSAAPCVVSNCQQWFNLVHQGEPKQFGKVDLSQVGPTQILQNTHAE